MAMIPLKQSVTVTKNSGDPWADDSGVPVTLKCRINDSVEIVTDSNGKEVVSTAQILLDKFADVDATCTFEYTDESGATFTRTPKSIGRKRWLNGKTLLTVVFV